MSSFYSRRGGSAQANSVVPPRVGHFYLTAPAEKLFCLNDTARDLLRTSVPIYPGIGDAALLHLDGTSASNHDLPLAVVRRTGQAHEASFLLADGYGTQQVLTWSAAPLVGADGAVAGVSATAVLTAKEPDWDKLAGLAHDLRTPLQSVRLLVSVAQLAPPPDVLADMLQRLSGTSERAMAIAGELLDWCRGPMMATQRAQREWLPLRPLLQSLFGEYEPMARQKGVALSADLEAADRVEVFSNKLRLGRVVGNLLGNAVRYTEVGHVTLTCAWRATPEDGGSQLVLAIEDTGEGLSEEDQDSIFQPFQRGRAGLSDVDSGGSGVGLATVDRLVSELGLLLEVSSQSGHGSRFELLVPADLVRRSATA